MEALIVSGHEGEDHKEEEEVEEEEAAEEEAAAAAAEKIKEEEEKEEGVFGVGQRVSNLAKFENSDEFFDGVIDSINRNGTIVVAFDDGDVDPSVPRPAHILKCPPYSDFV